MHTKLEDQDFIEQIIFIGDTLGPFFLEDPEKGNIQPALQAMQEIDANVAGKEWPFVNAAEATQAIKLMKQGLEDGIAAEDLKWEYRRLFVGPNRKPAPPWGSVYTDREMVVFGKTTLELRDWMNKNGITFERKNKEPEDHIGLMLLLLSWIARRQPNNIEEYLQKHLLTWSSHFLKQLEEASKHPFYTGLAKITRLSLEGLQNELELDVEYPIFYR